MCVLIINSTLLFKPAHTQSIKLRTHHRGELVENPIKWYINGEVSEMNWSWDVDYMPYM